MKKIISVFLSLTLLLTAFVPFVTAEDAYMLGDIDGDGKIKAKDARTVLRAAAGLEALGDNQMLVADATSDGAVKAADAREILRTAAGLIENINIYSNYYIGTSLASIAMGNGYFFARLMSGTDASSLFGSDIDLSILMLPNGDVIMMGDAEKIYHNFTVEEQEGLAKMMDGENFREMLDIEQFSYTIPKLSSFAPQYRESVEIEGKQYYRVTVQAANGKSVYLYKADYTPYNVRMSDSNGRPIESVEFEDFSTSTAKYFTTPAGYTEVTDFLEFFLRAFPGMLGI